MTVVEPMPVFQFDPGEGNYWGYNPISFFAPNSAYANRCGMCEQHTEFRELVRALHAAGLEVVLDVVYNHTGEGNHAGPVYSFKGLDNDTYYIVSGRAAERGKCRVLACQGAPMALGQGSERSGGGVIGPGRSPPAGPRGEVRSPRHFPGEGGRLSRGLELRE